MSSLADIQARLSARKRAAAASAGSAGAGSGPAKRWKRKGEIDAAAEKAYREEAEARRKAREEKILKDEEDLRRRNGSGSAGESQVGVAKNYDPTSSCQNGNDGEDVGSSKGERGGKSDGVGDKTEDSGLPPLEKPEVIRRLRSLGEPVTYYGESDWDRFRRLRNINLARESEGHGQKNIFQDKMREIERQDAVRQAHEYAGAEYVEVKADRPGRTSQSVENGEGDSGRPAAGEWSVEGDKSDEEPSCSEEYVLREIRRLVALWQGDVDEMSPEVRRTNKGRTAMVTLEQTKEWLKPLNKQLRKRRLPPKILSALGTIFRCVRERDYLRANNAYYEELAIGKAPWPMGATMVGIHARAAREKIGEDKIAHVMNDEQTRKYIQAVKRLVSLSQKHFP